MIQVAMKCPCGTHATVDITAAYEAKDRWSCLCTDCYDPTDHPGGRSETVGYGASPEEAIADWWAMVEQTWELDYEPVTLFAEISEQAGDEADRQEGWQLRPMLMVPNYLVNTCDTSHFVLFAPSEVAP
jgi:hypothetical protein